MKPACVIDSASVVSGTGSVRFIGAIVDSLAVVQEGEAFDDVEPCAVVSGHPQSVEAHPRPVRRAVYAAPVESKLMSQQVQKFGFHHDVRIIWVNMRRVKDLSIPIMPTNM